MSEHFLPVQTPHGQLYAIPYLQTSSCTCLQLYFALFKIKTTPPGELTQSQTVKRPKTTNRLKLEQTEKNNSGEFV